MNLEISKHTDARDADGYGYAINVKDWRDHAEGGTESQREWAYDSAIEAWWGNATSIAVEHGFAGAFAGGRSGGWCIPYYETNGRTRYVHTTDAEIAELGDDATEAERDEAKRFHSFAADIESLYDAFPALFADELGCAMNAQRARQFTLDECGERLNTSTYP